MTTEKKWIDPQGRTVPDHLVTDAERMKHDLAERLLDGADELQGWIVRFKTMALNEMYAGQELLHSKYDAKVGGKRGGFGFRLYDGSGEVRVEVADRVTFGPELQVAKSLIDECLEDWVEGANKNLRLLVEDAFQVNKSGRIDTDRVLSLRKHKMTLEDGSPDERWARAMEAVTDALVVDQTATYLRFYRRHPQTNERKQVVLDFAALPVAKA